MFDYSNSRTKSRGKSSSKKSTKSAKKRRGSFSTSKRNAMLPYKYNNYDKISHSYVAKDEPQEDIEEFSYTPVIHKINQDEDLSLQYTPKTQKIIYDDTLKNEFEKEIKIVKEELINTKNESQFKNKQYEIKIDDLQREVDNLKRRELQFAKDNERLQNSEASLLKSKLLVLFAII